MRYRVALPYPADAGMYFHAISDLPWAMWLDSGTRDRYDILVAAPLARVVTRNGISVISNKQSSRTSSASPFALLRDLLGGQSRPQDKDIPFSGGFVGYWSYDLSRLWYRLPAISPVDEAVPDMAVGLYDWAIVLDHEQQSANLVSSLRDPDTVQQLEEIRQRLLRAETVVEPPFKLLGPVQFNFNHAGYAQAFARIKDYLAAGDCYQVNLAQRFAAPARGDGWAAYRHLRSISPAPFAAFLKLPGLQILSASPERFLRLRQGKVETRPIKGTRPRMQDAVRDAAGRQELQDNPKDRAENLMIVDLLRNDLSRCCRPGSVAVPRLFEVESHANVHHLVSTITGELGAGQDALTLLHACFPGGSITGAPKLRAMQIIEELEPHRRGVYCGAIGYIGYDGDMDCSIAIRTLVYDGHTIRGWAGGGIVADSDCAAEYRETLDKASAMLATLAYFGGELPAHCSL